jgi:hypothetical protein
MKAFNSLKEAQEIMQSAYKELQIILAKDLEHLKKEERSIENWLTNAKEKSELSGNIEHVKKLELSMIDAEIYCLHQQAFESPTNLTLG